MDNLPPAPITVSSEIRYIVKVDLATETIYFSDPVTQYLPSVEEHEWEKRTTYGLEYW